MNQRPEQRSDFLNEFDELNYLSDMIQQCNGGRAPTSELERFLLRFRELLLEVGSDDGSIILQDHWAVLHESEGSMAEAVEYRVRETERIDRLFSIGGPVGPINNDFLLQVLHSLHSDYLHINMHDEAAQVHKRIQSLRES